MYYAFFGLTKNPFGMAPDSAFLFLTARHREAVAGLTYAITERKGFLVLSGPAGTGKTTVLTWVLGRLSKTKIETSLVVNPMLTANEFLETVMLGFGIDEIPASRPRRFQKLEEFLVNVQEKGRSSALIIDEAHKLTPDLLEEIRLMGNYERNGEKLLQILLIGQSEIDTLLNRPDLCQLKQRICVRLTLEPLDAKTLGPYIQYRWGKAGGGEAPFSPAVIDRLHYWSDGVPRLVNSLSDNALMLAFADNQRYLQADHIDSVAKDLQLTPSLALNGAGSLNGAVSKAIAIKPEPPHEATPPNGTPVVPARLMTLERYERPQKSVGFFTKWAGKLGLA